MANRPSAEIAITASFVHRLVAAQVPSLASLALTELSRGWDNTNFRLGDELMVRVPHRQVAAPLIEHERRWLPAIADMVDLGVPAPIHHGEPTSEYPWPWSIVPFFDGTEAARVTLASGETTARTLGTFFCQLHVAAPGDAPVNPYRGVPLAERRESFERNLDALGSTIDVDAARAIFATACAAAPATDRVWLHGDLHTRNMVVNEDLVAAIDWGDICSGDRATDLAAAFMLVPDHVATVQRISGATDHDMERARGWAINFALIYLAHCDDDPVMGDIGERLIASLVS